MKNTLIALLSITFLLAGCTKKERTQKELEKEINTLESEATEFETLTNEIEESSKELNDILDEL